MASEIEKVYRERVAGLTAEYAASTASAQTLFLSALLALGLFLTVAYQAAAGKFSAWWVVLPAAALIVLVPRQHRARHAAARAMRLLAFYERALGRVDGTRVQSGETGDAFREAGHLYERDLNVLGSDSLFGMLATTRTAVGQRALAKMLLHPVTVDAVRGRQAAVSELAGMMQLREQVELLGYTSFQQIPSESFEKWLAEGTEVFQPWMRWALAAVTVSWMTLALVAIFWSHDVASLPRNLAGLLAVQATFAMWLRPRVVPELDRAQRLAGQTAILRDGLAVLKQAKFSAPLLNRLQSEAAGEGPALKSLARTLMLLDQRAKEWYYLPSTLMGVGSHTAMALDAWRTRHRDDMRRWVACWAEFEAMLAVSTYAVEHAANVYPEVVEGEPQFAGKGVAHPLLPSDAAVRNDVQLGGATRFLLISGSNMAGKSTLLRAVGCNVVLAMTGAPVCAQALTLSTLRVGASLALVDSLAEGKSKFLAEVERLRDLVAIASERAEGGCLFLIDEIFSGTNSADRREAAQAVLRALVADGAIGALSTHDLALAELAEMPDLRGLNVHMASADESDPLGFDYLLKAGVNKTTNAMAIVRMLGLDAVRAEE